MAVSFALQAGLDDPIAFAKPHVGPKQRASPRSWSPITRGRPRHRSWRSRRPPSRRRRSPGTYVANAGVRDPLQLAADVATLDLVSHGPALLGIGRGHTPAEWTMSGREYPSPDARVTRLIESVEVIEQLLAGETVNYDGDTVVLATQRSQRRASARPDPVADRRQQPAAARVRRCDRGHRRIVGLGPSAPTGTRDEVRWRDEISTPRSGRSTAAHTIGMRHPRSTRWCSTWKSRPMPAPRRHDFRGSPV